jgi:uroporphyrinogen-III decarboxylase
MPSSVERERSDSPDGSFAFFQGGVARMAAALQGSCPRVPVHAQMHEFVAAQLGIPRPEFFTRPEVMVPAMLEVEARYGLDVASITYDVYNIEAEALGQGIRWSEAGMPDIDRTAPLIRDRDDLSRIRTPDFDSIEASQRVLRMHGLFRSLTRIEPGLRFCAPFTLATNLRGIEQFLVDIYTDPAFARDLLTRITEEVLAPWILYQGRHFPNSTSFCGVDATASPPIVNLALLREWVMPPLLRLRELCGPGVFVDNWVGERYLPQPEAMLDLKRDIGSGVLLGQDPDVETLGPAFYKEYAERHKLPLVLGVGASFLAQSSPEAIAERVRHYVAVGGRGGRFALYLCNVGATTPPENLRAAVDAAHGATVS